MYRGKSVFKLNSFYAKHCDLPRHTSTRILLEYSVSHAHNWSRLQHATCVILRFICSKWQWASVRFGRFGIYAATVWLCLPRFKADHDYKLFISPLADQRFYFCTCLLKYWKRHPSVLLLPYYPLCYHPVLVTARLTACKPCIVTLTWWPVTLWPWTKSLSSQWIDLVRNLIICPSATYIPDS